MELRETHLSRPVAGEDLQLPVLDQPATAKNPSRAANHQRSDSSRARSRMLIPSSTTSSDAVSGTSTRSTFA